MQHAHTYIRSDGREFLPVPPGVCVVRVDPGSPASDAGLKPGDQIVRLNGISTKMDDYLRFAARIADFRPGEEVSLLLNREGKEFTVELTLGRRPTPATTARYPSGQP